MEFEKAMEQHFEDDKKNFGDLNRKQDKLSEQMVINGEHLSHFNKNLVEINTKFDGAARTLKVLEDRYSNRELDVFFKESKEQWARIEVQTMKTNGRVSSLEDKVLETDKLAYGIKLTTAVTGGIIALVLTLIGYIFIHQTDTTNDAIKELKASIK